MLSNRAGAFFDHCCRYAQLAWPRTCVLCAEAIPASVAQSFCAACEASLPMLPRARCTVCAIPLPAGEVCGACLQDPRHFDAVAAPWIYGFPVDALIQGYKYGGDLTLAPVLAAALAATPMRRADVLVPMPLAPARLRERGFNQAQELARYLGRSLRVPVAATGVRKVAETAPQAALPWKARAGNVRGAFVCDSDFSGKHIAIVDDVMTTGATLNELARVLKAAGAVRVSGWVVARTLRGEE